MFREKIAIRRSFVCRYFSVHRPSHAVQPLTHQRLRPLFSPLKCGSRSRCAVSAFLCRRLLKKCIHRTRFPILKGAKLAPLRACQHPFSFRILFACNRSWFDVVSVATVLVITGRAICGLREHNSEIQMKYYYRRMVIRGMLFQLECFGCWSEVQ